MALKDLWNLIRARPVDQSRVNMVTMPGTSLIPLRSDLYNIAEIRVAIQKSSNHFARIKFNHIKYDNKSNNRSVIRDSIYYCLNVRSNKDQTAFAFKQQLATLWFMGKDVFIKPTWSVDIARPRLQSLETINYLGYQVGIDLRNRETVVQFYLVDGKTESYYLSDLWFLQRFPLGLNPSNNESNKRTISDWIEVANGVKNASLKASERTGDLSVIIATQQNLKGEHYKKKVDEINEQITRSKNGVVFIGGATTNDITPVNVQASQPQPQLFDEVVNQIYKFYESNKKIVGGEASSLEFEQYIDSAIKPLVAIMEQESTYKCFSREAYEKGNYIEAHLVDVTIASMQEKTAWYKELLYAGGILIDEFREQNGLPPMPNGLGQVPMINKNAQSIESMLKGGGNNESESNSKTSDGSSEDSN